MPGNAAFELSVQILVTCVTCGREREFPEAGQILVTGEQSVVVRMPNQCECGENRAKILVCVDST